MFITIIPKVLIVDDVKSNRILLRLSLQKSGKYQFIEASNGAEAIEMALKERPHIILMDAIMPVMDGFEAIECLRNNPLTKKTPIIMVSSLKNDDDKVKVLAAGSSDFISKPFDTLELTIRVNSLLSLYISFLKKEQELEESNAYIQKLLDYDILQQQIAKNKIESCIVNDFDRSEVDVLYLPYDILSGDFYSLFKRKDGSKFIYLIDGQGHGISPAMSVFAVASTINSIINQVDTLEELIGELFPAIRTFLGEYEQLSFLMIMIGADGQTFSYSGAGMYPILIKYEEKILKLKSNNPPFMNFSPNPQVRNLLIHDWEAMALYSDGLIEYVQEQKEQKLSELFLDKDYSYEEKLDIIKDIEFDDDVTYIHIHKNIGCK